MTLFLCSNDARSQIMNVPKDSSGFRTGFVGPSLPEFNRKALALRISIYLYTYLSSIYPYMCIDRHTSISFSILNTSKYTTSNTNEFMIIHMRPTKHKFKTFSSNILKEKKCLSIQSIFGISTYNTIQMSNIDAITSGLWSEIYHVLFL